jgi:hypothetical protein
VLNFEADHQMFMEEEPEVSERDWLDFSNQLE